MTELAIMGGAPQRTAPWPKWPIAGSEERSLVDEVLTSGRWSYEGPMETRFTEAFASYHGVKHGFCVSNGTVSLEIALRAAGVGEGDEVIVPSLTWLATATAVLAAGATVVFADVDPETYQLDPAQVERAVTDRTRAVIPVHLYCRMADLDAIGTIAAHHGLTVIEDCAHAHGASWNGGRAGSHGDVGTFSFQASKTLACGEGGYVATSDDDIAERVYGLKNCGRSWRSGRTRYIIGWNYRITEMQAAILLGQLGRLEGQLETRAKNMGSLDDQLAQIDGIRPLARDSRIDRTPAYGYVVRYDGDAFGGVSVDTFRAALTAEGIPVDATYGAVYSTALWGPDFAHRWRVESGDVAERVNDEAICISQPLLLGNEADLADIVEAVRKIKRHANDLDGLEVEPTLPASVAAPRH